MGQLLTERYRERLAGVLSCYDRIIITGTLPEACYAGGMMRFLLARQIRIFDYPQFAAPLRDRIRERATVLAGAAGVAIEHIAKSHIRKEEVVAKVLAERGDHPGLVHVISAMEGCDTYQPWHDKQTHKTFLRPDTGKCLHYYFYFIDAELGLIYLRVPTWCPFRLQFYCNGHGWLARKLTAAGIGFATADNAFIRIDDWGRAQALADTLSPDDLHRILDRLTQPRPIKGKTVKGLNFFSHAEQILLSALHRPGFNIAGIRRADILALVGQFSPASLSRQLARLRQLGVIKRVAGTYRYYLTRAGRAAIAAGRRLTEHTLIPALT
jgi:hypothetical protein